MADTRHVKQHLEIGQRLAIPPVIGTFIKMLESRTVCTVASLPESRATAYEPVR